MSTEIELPALVANDTLGFLAALGTMQLCARLLDDPLVRLGWPNGPSVGAVLTTSVANDIAALAGAMAAAALRMSGEHLVPGRAGFPPVSDRTADTDPIRMFSFDTGREHAALAKRALDFEPWLTGLLALDEPIRSEKRRGALSVTPLAARGPGTVMLARTMSALAKASSAALQMEGALTLWVREDSIAGYIDARAKRNAAYPASRKDFGNYGVKAASWLALMSTPFFTALPSNTDIAIARGWRRDPRRQPRFRWPVWSASLDLLAVEVLLGHPEVSRTLRTPRLLALGVSAVFESERTVEGNNDGPMSLATRLWPKKD